MAQAYRSIFPDGFQRTLVPLALVSGSAYSLERGDFISTFAITAGAQTATIAAPAYAGQKVILQATTDAGGSVVVTVASTINAAGNNTITFADAGDTIGLVGVGGTTPATTRWAVEFNDGAALSTV